MLELDYPGPLLEQVRQAPVERYLAVLMRIARVNEVSVAERNLAVALGLALEASEEATIQALRLADDETLSLEDLLKMLPPEVLPVLYRDACRMGWADGNLDEREAAFLDSLAVAMGLPAERWHPIRDLVGHIARAQVALVRHL